MRVAVLDTTKKPLAPTTPRRARLLLKKGSAAVFRRYPFTIILKREIVNPSTPDLKLKMELVKFDTQLMENPEINGVEYQQGELLGFELREYVLLKFNHACVYASAHSPCDQALNVDHIIARSRGGSNRVSNLVCACRKHNEEKNNLTLEEYGRLRGVDFSHVKARAKAPLKDAAAVNATRCALLARLKALSLPTETGSGGLTKFNRTKRGLPKTHWIDAACVGESTPENLEIGSVEPLLVRATGHGSRRMCRTDRHGFPKAHRTRNTSFMGFETGDIVRAEIPGGKFAGRHTGRLSAVRQRPSFTLNGFDVHPKYLKRIHRSDGYEYQWKIKDGSRANARQRKALGHSTTLP